MGPIYKPGEDDLPIVNPDLVTTPAGEDPAGTLEIPVTETPTQTTQVACVEVAGEIHEYEIPWQDEMLNGRIYTPPCYSDSDQNYPTLYLLHGATESDQQWDEMGVDEAADDLIARGEIPPLLLVMPRESTWVSLPDNPFGDQMIQAIIPWVDLQYRTLPEREYRAVGGLSRGGNWALRLGLLHWGLFGSWGGHSAPLFYGDLNRVPGWLDVIPEDLTPRIYLDIGEDDNNIQQAEELQAILDDAGIPHEWHRNPGLHDENYWRSHLEEYLLWYSAGWKD